MNEQLLNWANLLVFLSFAYPLQLVWRALRATSLRHAVGWLFLAWLGWLAALVMPIAQWPVRPVRYVALCLTACVFVAVLGARKPGVAAWNFVVVALLAVLALPLIQQPWQDAGWQLENAWAITIGAILLFAAVNYYLTAFILVAFGSLGIFGLHLLLLVRQRSATEEQLVLMPLLVAAAATVLGGTMALLAVAKRLAEPNGLWKSFRDYYGLVWGKRVQDQFNAAAKNAGWHVRLEWIKGIQPEPGHPPPSAEQEEAMLRTLEAVLKPFGFVMTKKEGKTSTA